MRTINEIIIHCTATPAGRDYTIDAIRCWHKNRGFQDIGYHYVIHLDGTVDVGRPLSLPGAHCLGHNAHSLGIAYVGGTDDKGRPTNTMTVEQEFALVKLVTTLKGAYPIGKNLHGHNEYSSKRCPCFDVQKWRKKWEV